MKFFISDTEQLNNKFGKWYYHTDSNCKIFKNEQRVVIYNGYTIEKTIEEYIESDLTGLEQANGKFCAVVLEKNVMKVIVDYWAREKIYYRNADRFEVANRIYLFPLKSHDVDIKQLKIMYDVPVELEGTVTSVGNWTNYDYRNKYPDSQYNEITCKTLFKNITVLQPDHMLVYDDKLHIKRIHNTGDEIMDALKNKDYPFKNTAELEDYIHKCMDDHASIIKKNYKDIVVSVSEGIDSALQKEYFPNTRNIMYHFKNPEVGPFEYKQKMIDRLTKRNEKIQVDHIDLDKNNIKNVAKDLNDPNFFWLDTLPTVWQLQNLNPKPDIFMYGTEGDHIFMHKPNFLYSFLFTKQIQEENYMCPETAIEKYKDSYAGKKNMWAREGENWPRFIEKFKGADLYASHKDNYENDAFNPDASRNFANACLPNFYLREMTHQTDIEASSIYADKRFVNSIRSMSHEVIVENMAYVTVQKNILKEKFNVAFETPTKDAAGFNTYHIIKPMITSTIEYCMKDHLLEA